MKSLLHTLWLFSTLSYAEIIRFSPIAKIFDDGQKVVALTLETQSLNLERKALNPKDFEVHAKGTLPFDAGNNKVLGLVNHQRPVDKALCSMKKSQNSAPKPPHQAFNINGLNPKPKAKDP
ncbi:MAG: hypothetical protein Q4B71_05560 [Cardiobacteriaceae bacterium]|nr:hypothetical protein [Cardiobacteriaceae bacterium]